MDESPKGSPPEDPLNSYQQPSWRGLIITVVLVIVGTAAIWLLISNAF